MAHIYSKGWFIQELKKHGVTKIEGRKLKAFKTHVLSRKWDQVTEEKEK